MSRRHDPRRAKPCRSYDCSEIAHIFAVTIATARRWRKEGLRPIEDKRPYIFAGAELAEFLRRKNKPRQPLGPGEIFCVACKRPRIPAGDLVRARTMTPTSVQLIGLCPICGREMHLRVRLAELLEKAGNLDLRHEDGTAPLSGAADAPRIDSSEWSGR